MGKGKNIGKNAASITYGKEGILHGFKCLLLQDESGNVANAYSIASGLDYPGVGPKHCYLNEIGRVYYDVISDDEAIEAFFTDVFNERHYEDDGFAGRFCTENLMKKLILMD